MNIRTEIAKAIHGSCGVPECKGWNEHDLPIADRVIATGINLSPRRMTIENH